MKLKLPHREVSLDTQISYEERNVFINSLLKEEIIFQEDAMSIEEYFRHTWTKPKSITCMDIIGYYLTKGDCHGEDREVLSHKKAEELRKGSKRHTTFSSIDYKKGVELGIIDIEEY